MTSAVFLELVRQLLRWLSLYLVGVGLPPQMAVLVEHPEVVAQVVALASLALAETGWLIVKAKQLRTWIATRSWWGS
jgi:hypothetical protein